MTDLVDIAQRASYQLSGAATTKLRKLTRAAGLPSENIVSRVALAVSLREPLDNSISLPSATGKEIKGSTLLGKRRPATLLVALVCRQANEPIDHERIRGLIRYNWERGLTLLEEYVADSDLITWIAARLSERAGDSDGYISRDDVASAIGRQFGRWPIEVRRLIANAGQLDLPRSMALARSLAREVEAGGSSSKHMSESVVLAVLRDSWGINRLGLDRRNRAFLSELLHREHGVRESGLGVVDRNALPYLRKIGLVVESDNGVVQLSAYGREAGPDLWSLR